ncbi:hypothetical protein SDC9_134126 [bioreactor metagenome]|uniref:Uncharacterized protein n=1 Tax=bioreactor metagenome TaxID=1076179 RepID=A0A645DDW5_9ZZZZ
MHAHQFLLQVVVAQAVTVVQLGRLVGALQLEPLVAQLRHPADGAAWCLGGVERADIVLATIHEIVGELAVEVLVRVGLEGEGGAS